MSLPPVVFSPFGQDDIKKKLCAQLNYEEGLITIHQFPDKEAMVRIDNSLQGKTVIFVASTDNPNEKTLPLLLAVETAKELGAKTIGLVTPYLAYMRQDIQFHSGEGISSKYYATLLSSYFDWLITIDPHLHRWHSLDQIYSIQTKVLHATLPIAHWIKQHVVKPILIGPDKESTQWVSEIANQCQAPYLIVEKTRFSDTHVQATIPNLDSYPEHTPVLVDDIISTGMTMIETIKHIQSLGMNNIICVGVHAIFADNAFKKIKDSGVKEIVTCNTISHPTNQIDITPIITDAIRLFITE